MSCLLVIRDFVLGLTDVSVARTWRQWLKIRTSRVLGVEVGIVQEIQRVSLATIGQWNAFDSFNARCSSTDRKKSSNRHSGESTSLTLQCLSSSAPGKQAAPSLVPPPLTTPPLSEGSRIKEAAKSDRPKRTRVSSSTPLLASQQEERGGDTDSELTEEGNTPLPFSPPPSSGEGRTGASPPQSSPITSKALPSSRPSSLATHPYPRSDREGEVGEGCPHSPTTLSKRFLSGEGEGEGAGELSQTGKLRQGNLGSHPAPAGRSNISMSMRALTSCPLAARQPPYRGLCDPTRKLRSGRAGNRPPFIKVRRGPTGNFRSPTTHYRSHMSKLTRYGNKAAPTTSPGRGNPYHTARTPLVGGICATGQPSMLTATT